VSETTVYVTLKHVECANCGSVFGIADNLHRNLMETGATFYCPNGHAQHFTEGEVERLKRELSRAESERVYYKTQLTRTRNRVAAGVCPCCNRSFENLRRHMATKHKDFAAPETTPEPDAPIVEWIGAAQAAETLGVSMVTVYNAAKDGRLPGSHFTGNSWRIPKDALTNYTRYGRRPQGTRRRR